MAYGERTNSYILAQGGRPNRFRLRKLMVEKLNHRLEILICDG